MDHLVQQAVQHGAAAAESTQRENSLRAAGASTLLAAQALETHRAIAAFVAQSDNGSSALHTGLLDALHALLRSLQKQNSPIDALCDRALEHVQHSADSPQSLAGSSVSLELRLLDSQQAVASERDRNEQLNETLRRRDAEVSMLREQLVEKDNDIAATRARFDEVSAEHEHEKATLRSQLENAQSQLESTINEQNKLEMQLDEAERSCEHKVSSRQEAREQFEELYNERECNLNAQVEAKDAEDSMSKMQSENEHLSLEVSTLKEELRSINVTLAEEREQRSLDAAQYRQQLDETQRYYEYEKEWRTKHENRIISLQRENKASYEKLSSLRMMAMQSSDVMSTQDAACAQVIGRCKTLETENEDLQTAQEHLQTRLESITSDLEQERMAHACTYQQMKTRLDHKVQELSALSERYSKVSDDRATFKSKLQEVSNNLDAKSQRIEELLSELDIASTKRAEAVANLEDTRRNVSELRDELTSVQADRRKCESRRAELEKQIQSLNQEYATLVCTLELRDNQLADKYTVNGELITERFWREWFEAEAKSLSGSCDELQRMRQLFNELESERSVCSEDLQTKDMKLRNAQAEVIRLEGECSQMYHSIAEYDGRLKQLHVQWDQKLYSKDAEVKVLNDELNDLRPAVENAQSARKQAELHATELAKSLANARAALRRMRNKRNEAQAKEQAYRRAYDDSKATLSRRIHELKDEITNYNEDVEELRSSLNDVWSTIGSMYGHDENVMERCIDAFSVVNRLQGNLQSGFNVLESASQHQENVERARVETEKDTIGNETEDERFSLPHIYQLPTPNDDAVLNALKDEQDADRGHYHEHTKNTQRHDEHPAGLPQQELLQDSESTTEEKTHVYYGVNPTEALRSNHRSSEDTAEQVAVAGRGIPGDSGRTLLKTHENQQATMTWQGQDEYTPSTRSHEEDALQKTPMPNLSGTQDPVSFKGLEGNSMTVNEELEIDADSEGNRFEEEAASECNTQAQLGKQQFRNVHGMQKKQNVSASAAQPDQSADFAWAAESLMRQQVQLRTNSATSPEECLGDLLVDWDESNSEQPLDSQGSGIQASKGGKMYDKCYKAVQKRNKQLARANSHIKQLENDKEDMQRKHQRQLIALKARLDAEKSAGRWREKYGEEMARKLSETRLELNSLKEKMPIKVSLSTQTNESELYVRMERAALASTDWVTSQTRPEKGRENGSVTVEKNLEWLMSNGQTSQFLSVEQTRRTIKRIYVEKLKLDVEAERSGRDKKTLHQILNAYMHARFGNQIGRKELRRFFDSIAANAEKHEEIELFAMALGVRDDADGADYYRTNSNELSERAARLFNNRKHFQNGMYVLPSSTGLLGLDNHHLSNAFAVGLTEDIQADCVIPIESALDVLRHPAVHAALQSLWDSNGMEFVQEHVIDERFWEFAETTDLGFKVDAALPQLESITNSIADTLVLPKPDLYVRHSNKPTVLVFNRPSYSRAIVVVTSSLLELVTPLELQSCLAARIALSCVPEYRIPFALIFIAELQPAFIRESSVLDVKWASSILPALKRFEAFVDVAGDRASLLAVQSKRIVQSAIVKVTSGCKELAGAINVDAVEEQARQLRATMGTKLRDLIQTGDLSKVNSSLALLRVNEVSEFDKSEEYRHLRKQSQRMIIKTEVDR